MPVYRVTNRITKETYEVEAPYAQNACEKVGWLIGDCHVQQLRETPFTDLSASPRRVEDKHEVPLSERIASLEKRVQNLEELLCTMNEVLETVYFKR